MQDNITKIQTASNLQASYLELRHCYFHLLDAQSNFLQRVNFADVLGVDQVSETQVDVHTFAKESYQVNSWWCCRKKIQKRRVVRTISLVVGAGDLLKNQILSRMQGVDYQEQPQKKNLIVLINPFGGAGIAPYNWRHAQTLFELAKSRINYTVIQTTSANFAYNFAKTMDADEFDGIVSVSGDGLLHEIINGIMSRPDFDSIREKITVGAIPGGTGNGLIKTLLTENNEDYGVQEAAWLIIRGQRSKIDLTELKMEYHTEPVYSFLSFAWSTIADIDLNSEPLRWIGPFRFELWGAYRCANLLKCRGDVLINGPSIHSTAKSHECNTCQLTTQLPHTQYRQQDFVYFMAINMPFIACNKNSGILASPTDGFNDIVTSRMQQGAGHVSMAKLLLALDSGEFFSIKQGEVRKDLAIDYFKASSWSLDPFAKCPSEPFSLGLQYEYSRGAVFSIDGERYPAQQVSAKVLNQAFPFYM